MDRKLSYLANEVEFMSSLNRSLTYCYQSAGVHH